MEPTANPPSVTFDINRRAWLRFYCDLGSSCEAPASDSACHWPARIKDISRGGARLLFHRSVADGTLLHIRMDGSKNEAPPVLRGQVVHCRQEPTGRWAVGCRFLEPLPSEQLEALLA